MQTAARVCKRLNVTGAALKLEVSDTDTEDFHPHIHLLADTPSGGRNFISQDDWMNEWLGQLPTELHAAQGGAHIEAVRDLAASCAYISKSAFAKHLEAGAETVRRIVASITATKGLQKFKSYGSLKAA
jgi:hypothetical protein